MLFQKQIGTDDNHDECKGIGYMSHAIPQNFYNNYYLLKLLCKCFYGSSEHYGVAAMALGKGLARSGGHRFCTDRSGNGDTRKRTEEDDVRFAQSFEKLVLMTQAKEGEQNGTV